MRSLLEGDAHEDSTDCGNGCGVLSHLVAGGGPAEARKGLEWVMREGDAPESWTATSTRYREWLYVTGESKGLTVEGKPVRPESSEQVAGINRNARPECVGIRT